jgi:isocitrate dehydrogenase
VTVVLVVTVLQTNVLVMSVSVNSALRVNLATVVVIRPVMTDVTIANLVTEFVRVATIVRYATEFVKDVTIVSLAT